MKRPTPILSILALLFLVGCTTLFTSVVTITTVVDTTMKAWADLSVHGKTSPAIDAKVKAAHDKYRASCSIAQNALFAYKASGDPTQYNAAVLAVKTAAQELLNLITPLLTQMKAEDLQKQLYNATKI